MEQKVHCLIYGRFQQPLQSEKREIERDRERYVPKGVVVLRLRNSALKSAE